MLTNQNLLVFNPEKRFNTQKSLTHSYFDHLVSGKSNTNATSCISSSQDSGISSQDLTTNSLIEDASQDPSIVSQLLMASTSSSSSANLTTDETLDSGVGSSLPSSTSNQSLAGTTASASASAAHCRSLHRTDSGICVSPTPSLTSSNIDTSTSCGGNIATNNGHNDHTDNDGIVYKESGTNTDSELVGDLTQPADFVNTGRNYRLNAAAGVADGMIKKLSSEKQSSQNVNDQKVDPSATPPSTNKDQDKDHGDILRPCGGNDDSGVCDKTLGNEDAGTQETTSPGKAINSLLRGEGEGERYEDGNDSDVNSPPSKKIRRPNGNYVV